LLHGRLLANGGEVSGRLHPAVAGDAAVLWCSAPGAASAGRAGGLYSRLGQRLRAGTCYPLSWLGGSRPGLASCVADAMAGLDWLATQGRRQVALVGHSFGGAVVIAAGAAREEVVAVAALSSQAAGTELALAWRRDRCLLVHGLADEILPAAGSRDIHRRAAEPKEIILYAGCRHGSTNAGTPLIVTCSPGLRVSLAAPPRKGRSPAIRWNQRRHAFHSKAVNDCALSRRAHLPLDQQYEPGS
jgi:dienelactone hydrolase